MKNETEFTVCNNCGCWNENKDTCWYCGEELVMKWTGKEIE